MGLAVNTRKTKYMPGTARMQQNDLEGQNGMVETVTEFCSFGLLWTVITTHPKK